MKKCFKCNEAKSLDDFYKHPEMADGRVNKCKECNKLDVRNNRAEKIEYFREYDRKRASLDHRQELRDRYAKTDKGRASARIARMKWEEENPEKKQASTDVGNAIRDGRLIRQNCFTCGSENSQGHHPDYSRPLDVAWLCSKHHAQLHKDFRELLRQT